MEDSEVGLSISWKFGDRWTSEGLESEANRGRNIDKKNKNYFEMKFWFFDKYDNEEDVTKNRSLGEDPSTFGRGLSL